MRVGPTGIGVSVSFQGIDLGALDFDRVEILLNREGLDQLRRGLQWLADSNKGGSVSEPLERHNGMQCVLRVTLDPEATP